MYISDDIFVYLPASLIFFLSFNHSCNLFLKFYVYCYSMAPTLDLERVFFNLNKNINSGTSWKKHDVTVSYGLLSSDKKNNKNFSFIKIIYHYFYCWLWSPGELWKVFKQIFLLYICCVKRNIKVWEH